MSLRARWVAGEFSVYRRLKARGERRAALTAVRNGKRPKPAHLLVGEHGEEAALFYLRARGCTVVARRWTDPLVRGDLDLVVWELEPDGGKTLVIVEVKTRSTRGIVPAAFSVNQPKQKQVRKLTFALLRTFSRDLRDRIPLRIDVLSVYLEPGAEAQVECLHDAFELHAHYERRA
jgi:putative endonuclease